MKESVSGNVVRYRLFYLYREGAILTSERKTDWTPERKTGIMKLLIVFTLCMIWGHSLVPAALSTNESMYFAARLNRLFGLLGFPLRFANDFYLRKMAHASEYALLGAEMTMLSIWCGNLRGFRDRLRVLLYGLGAAFLDETIQLFVPGRSGEIRDVWIDIGGYFLALTIISLILRPHRTAGDSVQKRS